MTPAPAPPALIPLPRIETRPSRLTNWRAWGFSSPAEMQRAFYPDDASTKDKELLP